MFIFLVIYILFLHDHMIYVIVFPPEKVCNSKNDRLPIGTVSRKRLCVQIHTLKVLS
jgi:hypothetical protein